MASTKVDESSSQPRIEPPASISPEARQALLATWPPKPDYPDVHDKQAWLDFISHHNEAYRAFFAQQGRTAGAAIRWGQLGGVRVAFANADRAEDAGKRVYMDLHGGALIYFGGEYMEPMVQMAARTVPWPIVSVDYRMPPLHPFPAGLDDCLAVYRALVDEHGAHNIVVGGSSAGGNLAVALMLRARDEGLPYPAGLVLLSPEVDLTESGDSFKVLDGLDRLGPHIPVNLLYAAGTPLDDPYVSPLFAEFPGDFPPTLIQSGTRDMLLSNAVRLHRALRNAGAPAELHVWEAMPHGKFFGAPEDLEVDAEIGRFIAKCWRDGRQRN